MPHVARFKCGMLTARLFTRAFAHKLNIHFLPESVLKGVLKNLAVHRTGNTIADHVLLHQSKTYTSSIFTDCLRQATRTAAVTISLHNQQSVCTNFQEQSQEAHLHTCHPHQGLHLTAVHHCNGLKWANAHCWWCLAQKKGVLFTDLSWFPLYRADGRQHVCHCVGEQFPDVNVVNHCSEGVMIWANICYQQQTQL